MKYTFNKFKRLLFESMLEEDKSRLIDRLVLPDIEDEAEKQKAREEMKAFFKKYNTWENKLDWNKLKTITYADFQKIKNQATQTKGAQKKEIAGDVSNIFKSVGNRKFMVMDPPPLGQENDKWLFVAPLTWEAAVYCDSSENQGAGATWCIGQSDDPGYWKKYIREGSRFLMAFNKNYRSMNKDELQTNLKFMIEKTPENRLNIWNQQDKRRGFPKWEFGITKAEVKEMLAKAEVELAKVLEDEKKKRQLEMKKKFEQLKKMNTIDMDFFSEEEKRELPETIVIPNSITVIGQHAFSSTQSIKKVILPETLTEIGTGAFSYCTHLQSINIPKKLNKINNHTFAYSNLREVEIPNSITQIGACAFNGCYKMKRIVIPESVKVIGEYAFSDCYELESIIIKSKDCKINKTAFYDCYNVKEFSIGGSSSFEELKKMSGYAWGMGSKLRKILN
jgi:hypothetical protein